SQTLSPMDTQQIRRQVPKIRFRVLIVGRANAGKTSILQRLCETTESPIVYWGKEEVRRPTIYLRVLSHCGSRGEHTIDDELVFSNHDGYVFHDSWGIESGGSEELQTLQAFIRRKCRGRRLEDRLHAIWYCVPMDNERPQIDLRYFKHICPDKNVPVIVLFTKYDQFRRNVEIDVFDYGNPDDNVNDVAEKKFQERYLRPLVQRRVPEFRVNVFSAEMHRQNRRCDQLIETTAAALNDDIVGSMLLAVQRDNLGLSVKAALNR
ncbi:GTP-binding protein, partial [Lactarius sanguifluus]